jgi:5-methylcytosine-specific restriction endonuclease McrA
MSYPKPAKREKRAPKPIQRKSRLKRGGRIRKPKALSRNWLRGIADELFSLLVRSRGYCEKRCGKQLPVTRLQASHGIGRAYLATRYDPINVMASCPEEHKRFTHRPFEFRDYLVAKWGQALFDRLWAKAQEGVRLGYRPDYEDLIQRLWRMEDVQRALYESSEAKQKRLTREVEKVLASSGANHA